MKLSLVQIALLVIFVAWLVAIVWTQWLDQKH